MAIITVSRGSLGLGMALAERLADTLGYPCLGRDVAREVAEKYGIPHDLVRKKIEESPTFWERLTAERTRYVVAMQGVLAERAREGALVYHGYAGHLLLKGMPALLRVRVIAPMEVRIPLAMEEQNLDADAAAAHIRKVDEARARWAKVVFGVDWQNPELYDMVLNLGVISVESACETVATVARRPEFAVTDAVRRRLEDFCLASRVRLLLVTDAATRAMNLEVDVRDGIAFVRGNVPQDPRYVDAEARFRKQLQDLVMSAEGIKHVSFGIHALPPPLTE